MAWRGKTTIADRIWAALPYIMPIAAVSIYGAAFTQLLPVAEILLLPISIIAVLYYTVMGPLGPYGGLLIFFGLYLFVVRNPKISHFIRYNTMQAMMIGIAVSLVTAVFNIFQLTAQLTQVSATLDPLTIATLGLFAAVFLFSMVASVYSLFFVVQGKYAEIKWISDAAYAQTQV